MIHNVVGHLGKPVDIGLPRPEITALDGVVKETKYGVAVVLIVLGRIDSALGGNGVGPAGAVLDAK